MVVPIELLLDVLSSDFIEGDEKAFRSGLGVGSDKERRLRVLTSTDLDCVLSFTKVSIQLEKDYSVRVKVICLLHEFF
jgi:hypothetical protein